MALSTGASADVPAAARTPEPSSTKAEEASTKSGSAWLGRKAGIAPTSKGLGDELPNMILVANALSLLLWIVFVKDSDSIVSHTLISVRRNVYAS